MFCLLEVYGQVRRLIQDHWRGRQGARPGQSVRVSQIRVSIWVVSLPIGAVRDQFWPIVFNTAATHYHLLAHDHSLG